MSSPSFFFQTAYLLKAHYTMIFGLLYDLIAKWDAIAKTPDQVQKSRRIKGRLVFYLSQNRTNARTNKPSITEVEALFLVLLQCLCPVIKFWRWSNIASVQLVCKMQRYTICSRNNEEYLVCKFKILCSIRIHFRNTKVLLCNIRPAKSPFLWSSIIHRRKKWVINQSRSLPNSEKNREN